MYSDCASQKSLVHGRSRTVCIDKKYNPFKYLERIAPSGHYSARYRGVSLTFGNTSTLHCNIQLTG